MKWVGKDPKLLVGWKDIANHLGVSPNTARRMHQRDNMPIWREVENGPPYCRVEDMDSWLEAHSRQRRIDESVKG